MQLRSQSKTYTWTGVWELNGLNLCCWITTFVAITETGITQQVRTLLPLRKSFVPYSKIIFLLGIGNDPREDRKFNMIKQSMDYDLDGNFIRLWVPELKEIAGTKIHSPWLLSTGALSAAKVRLGENYPNPIVVAPEWSRHQKDVKVSFHLSFCHFYLIKTNIIQGARHMGGLHATKAGNQRGIDFYFKNPAGKK